MAYQKQVRSINQFHGKSLRKKLNEMEYRNWLVMTIVLSKDNESLK